MDILPVSSKTNVYGMSESDYPSADAFGVSIFPRAYAQSFPQELEDQFKRMFYETFIFLILFILQICKVISQSVFFLQYLELGWLLTRIFFYGILKQSKLIFI